MHRGSACHAPEQDIYNKNQYEQDPKNKKKGGAVAPNPLDVAEIDTEFVEALCWCWFGHQELEILSRKDSRRLQKAAAQIMTAGYTINDLRRWFQDEWKTQWRWQKGRQRPTPEEVCSSIPAMRVSRYDRIDIPNSAGEYFEFLDEDEGPILPPVRVGRQEPSP